MKKLIAFAFLMISSHICMADTKTPRLGLILPTIGSPTWGQKINGNFQILDSTVQPGSIIAGATYYINNVALTAGSTAFMVSSGTVVGQFYDLSLSTGQCVQVGPTGLITTSGAPCGSGSGGGVTLHGPDKSIQTNQSGVLVGTGTLTLNTTTNLLTVGATTQFTNVLNTQWTNVSTMSFGLGTNLQLLYLSTGSCLQTDTFGNVVSSTQGPCGSGSGGGGSGDMILAATQTVSGAKNFTSPSGSVWTYGVTAGSFTSTGGGAGSLTLKNIAGDHFVLLEASDSFSSDQNYVLPSTGGTTGQTWTITGVDNTGKMSTGWANGSDPLAAKLNSTETFTATQNFAQSVNFTNISSTTFSNVTSMTFTNVGVTIVAGSTFTLNSGLSLNGSFGTAGQVPTSNGPNAALTWGAGGGGGGGGYNLEPATVTIQATQKGIISSTLDVTGLATFESSVTFSGASQAVSFTNQSVSFNSISTMTVNSADFDIAAGSTLTVNGSLQANNSYGSAGQLLQSNGVGAAPTWVTGSNLASSLAIATGSVSGFSGLISSPTIVVNFSTNGFNAQLTSGATAFITPANIPVSALPSTVVLSTTTQNVTGAKTFTEPTFQNTAGIAAIVNGIGINAGAFQYPLLIEGNSQDATSDVNFPVLGINFDRIRSNGSTQGDAVIGIRDKPGEDLKFIISGSSAGVFGNTDYTISPYPVTVNVSTGSASYGFVGIGVSTPTVSLDVSGGTIKGTMAPTSQTKAQLNALVPASAGLMYYCSDCTTDGIVVSTGTGTGAFGRISSRGTVIQ